MTCPSLVCISTGCIILTDTLLPTMLGSGWVGGDGEGAGWVGRVGEKRAPVAPDADDDDDPAVKVSRVVSPAAALLHRSTQLLQLLGWQ